MKGNKMKEYTVESLAALISAKTRKALVAGIGKVVSAFSAVERAVSAAVTEMGLPKAGRDKMPVKQYRAVKGALLVAIGEIPGLSSETLAVYVGSALRSVGIGCSVPQGNGERAALPAKVKKARAARAEQLMVWFEENNTPADLEACAFKSPGAALVWMAAEARKRLDAKK